MKILIVDNQAHNQYHLNSRLLKIHPDKISIGLVPNADGALQDLTIHDYEFIFVDLKLSDENLSPNEEPQYDGIQLCEDIKRHNPNTIIIIYSGDIRYREESKFSHYTDCKNAGADDIISKKELFDKTSTQLSVYLDELKKNKLYKIHNEKPILFEDDIKTKAFFEIADKDVIYQIVNNLLPNMVDHRVLVLQAGFSGSLVFLVKSSSHEPHKYNIENVVKISRSLTVLENELKRAPKPGSYLHSLSVTPSSIQPRRVDDWYCIAIPKVRNAMILSDVLATKKTSQVLKKTFNILIKTLVIEPIQEAFSWDYSKGIISENYTLTFNAGYEIIQILEDIIKWRNIISEDDLQKIKIVRGFVEQYFKDGYEFTNDNHKLALLHGDLHCRNIFFVKDSRPITIDFGRSSVYPRLFDAAALNIDLIISQMDAYGGMSYRYDLLDEWFQTCIAQYPFQNDIRYDKEAPVFQLLSVLFELLLKDVEDITCIEYADVLVFHLLRYIRFNNVTYPKKILIIRFLHALIQAFYKDRFHKQT